MRENIKILKWFAGGIEAFLAVPIFGGLFILRLLWIPLLIMLMFHITILVMSRNEKLPIAGNILGIVGSALGWIPLFGWIMHILTAIFVMIEASKINSIKE
ncbi:hypothetical protein [Clostridium fallax]|uniref:Uncharacterized protein n=1 Tax=Clostridium fallax TaxID=1533 RepID=A0A1M4SXP2_9CLOT|nr:hypothetical protein [Clostridium fallax]SHE36787.1 hypothetical protein SAMN05443638_101218 [Clostridium fallax]SQB08013.1 Uncharacterised protein [Clostridium fallax]